MKPARQTVPVIDVHSHFVPLCYLDGLKEQGVDPLKEDGFPTPSWSPKAHLAYMDQGGITHSVISLSSPHIHHGDGALAIQLARRSNEEAAAICRAHPDRFSFAACLPMPEIKASVDEICYAFDELGAVGIKVASNSNDYIIVTGDFGGVWDGSPRERYWLDWLEEKSFTTLFISGNHENFDMLAALPEEEWYGGIIQRVRPSVIHLTRGQVYDIEGKKFFTMGGASSHDISGGILEPDDPEYRKKLRQLNASGALYRVNHRSWWTAELPSQDEYQTARANLDQHGWAVDYIITHCCPTSVQDELSGGMYKADHLTDFLDEVAQRCGFKYWFFGHYHDNGVVGKKYVLLYEQIIKLKL